MMFQASEDQTAIIQSADSACILAGPGTGKSATALAIAKKYAQTIVGNRSVLFISFSNSAVKRLSQSAGIHLEQQRNLKFMTYHSLAWDIVKSYARFSHLPHGVGVMDEIERAILLAEGYSVGRDAKYDELLSAAKATGKVSFDIMLPLACKILDRIPQLRKIESMRFPLIIADEFQDTKEMQWHLLKQIGSESRIIVLGDLNQVIYQDDYAAAELLMENFKIWKGVSKKTFSHRSFRCTSEEILNFADCIIKKQKFVPKGDKQVRIASCYRNQFRASVAAQCLKILGLKNDKRIGILTASAAAAQKLAIDLKLPPVDGSVNQPIYARIPLPETSKDAFRIACIGLFDHNRKQTPATLKNAAHALVALRASFSSRSKINATEIAKLLKELSAPTKSSKKKKPLFDLISAGPEISLLDFEKSFLTALGELSNFKTLVSQIGSLGHSLINPSATLSSQMEFPLEHFRGNREPRGLNGDEVYQSKIEILSLWKSKGREFDYVIVVMDPRELSQKTSEETERRLLYVGATRAKEWLGVVYPTGSPGRALRTVLDP